MGKILEPLDRERDARRNAEAGYKSRLKSFFDERKAAIVRPLLAGYSPDWTGKSYPGHDDRAFPGRSIESLISDGIPPAFWFKSSSLLDKELERLLMLVNVKPFDDLPEELVGFYRGVSRDAMVLTVDQIRDRLDDDAFASLLKLANERSVAMAKDASAALVGKKWVDGALVDNPNAEWVISEATRELIRGGVSTALNEGWTNDRLAAFLMDPANAAFSESRAEMVARTEMADIDIKANYEMWRESGLVQKKIWLLSSDPCELCIGNYQAGPIDLNEDFPNGDAPVHPRCSCDIGAYLED